MDFIRGGAEPVSRALGMPPTVDGFGCCSAVDTNRLLMIVAEELGIFELHSTR